MDDENGGSGLVGITMGDAAGIGPEIVLKALADPDLASRCLVIGDARHLAEVADRLSLDIAIVAPDSKDHGLRVLDLKNVPPRSPVGIDAAVTGKAAAENVLAAVDLWRRGEIGSVATAPLSKKAISMAGYDYPGHTEFLADLTGTARFAMSFFADKLRVVLLSTHLPLTRALTLVRKEALVELIEFSSGELRKLLGREPKMAVAGLNPHASEHGMFGSEENDEIEPAVRHCRDTLGINVSGPYSPDTIFFRGYKGEFDVVVALYHDQATIPVKSLSFGAGVNVTLGLPLIRTSVDHGTAYDIAGKGIADASSMAAAIRLASELHKRENR
jgi:4-hydroxythreonine-4-phosphate dehydrogenase